MLLFFLLGLLISIFIINKIYFGKTSLETIKKELEKTRKIYKEEIPKLVSWTGKEIDLMSYHIFQKSERKGFGYSFRGIFTSIYQENMMIVQHKIPSGKKKNGFTIMITKNHEILCDPKNKIYINGELLGLIDKKGRFLNPKIKRIFGKYGSEKFNKTDILNEDGMILGAVKSPEDWELPFPRAMEAYEEMDTHNLIVFKVLAGKLMLDIYLAKHSTQK
ncbi:hypothetical protein [Membranihabitans maritimus]|uniref:hypothetical protein n=1 Tax=Membranihabitans maritimus TaxID=2904244 RepID=UPI001F3BE446|nr:hypothetical protein [Membranihabitans maritimus]